MKFSDLSIIDRNKIVELALSKKLSYKEIALQYNIPMEHVKSAAKRARRKNRKENNRLTPTHHKLPKQKRRTRPTYTALDKAQVIIDLYEVHHGSVNKTSKEWGMTAPCIRNWNKLFRQVGAELYIKVITSTMTSTKALDLAKLNNLDFNKEVANYQQIENNILLLKKFVTTAPGYDQHKELLESTLFGMEKSNESYQIMELANKLLYRMDVDKTFNEVDVWTKCQIIKKISQFKTVKFTITKLCKALKFNRATYYNNVDKPQSSVERRELFLKEAIIVLRTKEIDVSENVKDLEDEILQCSKFLTYLNYGARRLTCLINKMIEEKYETDAEIRELFPRKKVNHKVVEKVIRKYKLYAYKFIRDQRKAKNRVAHASVGDNLMGRDFQCSLPYEKIGTDTVTFTVRDSQSPNGKRKVYACIVLDFYSRKIIGYCMSKNPDTDSAIMALDMAMKNKPENASEVIMLQHDKGTQFTSQEYKLALEKYGIKESISGTGACYDNAPTESRFSCMRVDCEPKGGFLSVDHCIQAVVTYIDFHNNQRITIYPDTKKGLTPQEKIKNKYIIA